MNNPNYEDEIKSAIGVIKTNNPNAKDSTISTYTRLLRKLFTNIGENGADMRKVNNLPFFLYNTKYTIEYLELSDWGKALKDTSRKNYLSLILTLFRGLKESVVAGNVYEEYRKAFDILKGDLDAKIIKQEPTEDELVLKDIEFTELKRSLSYHYNKCRGANADEIDHALLNMLGHLHLDQVLRNEACDMIMTEKYLTKEEHPKQNFIWLKGRHVKMMVIRNNKVRNPDRGDEAKEVYLKGAVNTAINKYLQVLKNTENAIPNGDTTYPLVYSKSYQNHLCISSSHYSQIFKKIWSHINLELTTTMIRKVYAMDVRKKFKGNLVKEQEACDKLDHSKATHDKHYILFFD